MIPGEIEVFFHPSLVSLFWLKENLAQERQFLSLAYSMRFVQRVIVSIYRHLWINPSSMGNTPG